MLKTISTVASFVVTSGMLFAQHGGGAGMHAGASGMHAGPSTGRSFSTAPSRFVAPNRSSLQRGAAIQGGPQHATAGNWTSSGFFPTHSGAVNARGGQNGRRRFGYGYGGYPLLGYAGLGFYGGADNGGLNLDDNDPNDPNLQGNAGGYGDYAAGAPDGGPQNQQLGPEQPAGPSENPDYANNPSYGVRPAYNGNSVVPADDKRSPTASNDGLSHPKVSLVFKDGHKLQIENYAVTQTKVFVRDNGVERDIPLSALDLASTKAANDAAGVDFRIPGMQ